MTTTTTAQTRAATKTTTEYALAIDLDGEFYAWVAREFTANDGPHGNHSACTRYPAKARRWKTEAGARANAERYERFNAGMRVKVVPTANWVV